MKKFYSWIKFCFLFIFLYCFDITYSQNYIPIPIQSGFNADVIANGIGSSSGSTNSDIDGLNYAFVAQDFQLTSSSTPLTYGLPSDGVINSAVSSTPGLSYQLADYDLNNSLRLANVNDNGTLNFSTPIKAVSLYLLATSGSDSSNISCIIHFTDSSIQTINTINISDWYYNDLNYAVRGIGRINKINNMLESGYGTNPKIYQLSLNIDIANRNKEIKSIKLTKTAGPGISNIFAVSVDAYNSCTEPKNIVSTAGIDNASIMWTVASALPAGGYDYYLSTSETAPLSITTPTGNISGTSLQLNSLTKGQIYYIWIRSNCLGGSLGFWKKHSFTTSQVSVVYSNGDISTLYSDTDLTASSSSSCPGLLSISIPTGYQIKNTEVEYTMTSANSAFMSEQKSLLACLNNGNTESTISSGTESTMGTMAYKRKNISIANGLSGIVNYELRAWRTWGGSDCNTVFSKVDNNSWKIIITLEPSSLIITKSQTNVSCNNANNGSATVSLTGDVGNYTYVWSPSGGNATTASNLKAGEYTVTIKNSNGSSIVEKFTITEPPALAATTSQTNVSCKGGSNGSATVNTTGGTEAYTYLWAPSGGTNATANGLAVGTYTVTIKDANLCTITKTVTITEPDQLTAAISKTDVLCNGANNGTATVNPTGGTFPYTYSWSPSGGTNATATDLSPNTYTVTVTDANGCFITETIEITEPSALSLTDSKTNVSCHSANNGSASVTLSGGNGPYTYTWLPSGGTAATANSLSPGIYTVTATDANSCSISKTITITEPDVLAADATITDVSCHNGNDGSATITATGGTAPYTYLWPHSGEITSSVNGLTTGIYEVILTDSNSCTLSKSIEIKQPENSVNLNTVSVSEITVYGAKLSGTASSDGTNTDKGECLSEVGFVYALHTNPTTADTRINATSVLGNFTTSLSNLRGNRIYYVRTYAINSYGFTSYGNEVSFTTEKYTLSITASSEHTKVYGTQDPVFNYAVTGFANGDTNAIITGQLSRNTGENVGKYTITQGNINAGPDYTIVFTSAEFEITKANQTITWNQNLEFGCDDSSAITLTATTDNGLPVSYNIANNEIGRINESILTILNFGSTTITAFQNGDQNHNPAVALIKPIEVSQSGLITQQWADVLLFDNKSNSFISYQWYKNGNPVSGANRQYYSENQPLNGTYYVIAKNTNGNLIKSCPIEATGTSFAKNLKIHPNPIRPTNEFTLECDFSESQLNGSEITIFDITGKLVQTITNVKPQNQITAPSQSAIYVVVLSLINGQKKTINLLVK